MSNRVFMLMLLFIQNLAMAQNLSFEKPASPRPLLFADLPDTINVSVDELDNLLHTAPGNFAIFKLTGSFRYTGTIISGTRSADGQATGIIIRSADRSGSCFTLTKSWNDLHGFIFKGRILSFRHGDGYELVYNMGSYLLLKKSFFEIVNE